MFCLLSWRKDCSELFTFLGLMRILYWGSSRSWLSLQLWFLESLSCRFSSKCFGLSKFWLRPLGYPTGKCSAMFCLLSGIKDGFELFTFLRLVRVLYWPSCRPWLFLQLWFLESLSRHFSSKCFDLLKFWLFLVFNPPSLLVMFWLAESTICNTLDCLRFSTSSTWNTPKSFCLTRQESLEQSKVFQIVDSS